MMRIISAFVLPSPALSSGNVVWALPAVGSGGREDGITIRMNRGTRELSPAEVFMINGGFPLTVVAPEAPSCHFPVYRFVSSRGHTVATWEKKRPWRKSSAGRDVPVSIVPRLLLDPTERWTLRRDVVSMFSYGVSYQPPDSLLPEREVVCGPWGAPSASYGRNGCISSSSRKKREIYRAHSLAPVTGTPVFPGEGGKAPAAAADDHALVDRKEQDAFEGGNAVLDGSGVQQGIVRIAGDTLDASEGRSSSALDHSIVQLYKGTIENFKPSGSASGQGGDIHFYVGMPLYEGAGTMVVKNSKFVANARNLYHGIATAGSHAELYHSTVRLENDGSVIWGNDTNALFILDRDSRLSIASSVMVVNCAAVAENKTFRKGDETWFRLDLVSGGKGGADHNPLLEMMDTEGKLDASRFAVYMPGWMMEAGITSDDFLNGYHYDDGTGDAWFEFVVPPPVVPEPSLAMLAACGLMGLLLGRRK